MTTTNTIQSLLRSIDRLLSIVSLLADHESVKESQTRLKTLHRRLRMLPLESRPLLIHQLEMELYSIVANHPKLRQAFELAVQAEFVDICKDALEYYKGLLKKRPLTDRESEELRAREAIYQQETTQMEQLRKALFE
jgi:hypothetical protein